MTFKSSTTEVSVNNGESVVLGPNETRKVTVDFLSALSGEREESLSIYAPFSVPKQVTVQAQSGPLVFIPVLENM